MSQTFLSTPIGYLKGIGPMRAEALQKELHINTYQDLMTHYPFRYVDRTKFFQINEVNEDGVSYQLLGFIESMEIIGEKRSKRLVVKFRDRTGVIDLVWFQGHKWMSEKLKLQTEYIVYGKATLFNHKFNISHPDIEVVSKEILAQQSAFQPVYHSTEKLKLKTLDSEGIKKAQRILSHLLTTENIKETLTSGIIHDFKLISKLDALKQIHFPDSKEQLEKAKFRLKFEELFYNQLKLLRLNHLRHITTKGFVFSKVGDAFNLFYKNMFCTFVKQ